MAAPLSDCTIEERAVVRFLWAEGVKSEEIHRRMLAQYGTSTMHQRKIYEWIERFKEGRTSVTDESRPGRPSTSRRDKHIQRVDALIREDQ
jgi:transposase